MKLRQFRKSPVFTAVAVVTIALGIGANTAVFSVMNAVLLRSVAAPNPWELVYFHLRNQPLSTSQTGFGDMSLSMPVFEAMRARRDVFRSVMAFAPLAFDKTTVRIGAEPEQDLGEMVSGNFFSGLGVQPVLGRGFTEEDERTHAAIAVLSHDWWKRRFGGDSGVLGKVFYVKGVPLSIVGVAPPGFGGVDPQHARMDFWIPLQSRPELNAWGTPPTDHTLYGSPEWLALMMVGRLRPGISAPAAERQVLPLFRRTLASASPVDRHEQRPLLVLTSVRGIEGLREEYEQPLRFLMGMVGLVLLIACGNVVMLLMARNSARVVEFSLRQALGASRRALFWQLLNETAVLVGAGAALGWVLATAATDAITAWSGLEITAQPDQRVLLFTVLISVAVAMAFGLAPLGMISRLSLSPALRSSSGTAASGARPRFFGQRAAISFQISLCMVLLCAATLLYRSLRNVEGRALGMRTSGLLVFGITPQKDVHTDDGAVRFHNALLERMRALPGVDSATVMEVRLGSGGSNNDGVLVDGRNPLPRRAVAPMRTNIVGPDFLRTLGIPLQLGRDIESYDTATSPRVAIINKTFADRYLPALNPLGHHIAFFENGKVQYTIVGVCGDSRYSGVKERDHPMAYFPFTQTRGVLGMQYELHTNGNPKMLVMEATKAVHASDPDISPEKPMTQEEQFAESVSQDRLMATLSIFFGALAAFLVAIGLYGSVSYTIGRRRMEFGVRMALGAQRSAVLRMVLLESLAVAACGLAVGVAASLAVARSLRSMLYGLSPSDPLALVVALGGIAIMTLLAAFLPARRAASIDPMRALRSD